MINSNDFVACICEGNTEKNIMELLLGNNDLIFQEEQLVGEEVLYGKFRKPEIFTDQYLTMDFEDEKIVILIIQDSNTPYQIKPVYLDKIKETCLVITSPEIEMLMIHSLGLYDDYQKVKPRFKPSKYLSQELEIKTSKLKQKEFIIDFYRHHSLIDAIKMHAQKSSRKRGCYLLADILK